MSWREVVVHRAAAEASEERSKAKVERNLLEARRRELDDDALRKVADGLQGGQKMLAAVREKLVSDLNHFEEERQTKEATLVSHANQLFAREQEIRQRDVNLDIREADVMEREGALEDRLTYFTSCEEQASSRETALNAWATQLEFNEGALIKRRA